MTIRTKQRLSYASNCNAQTSPIFVGGAGRSGTSLLRTLLNAHSHIAIGAELKATPLIAQFWSQLSQFTPHLKQHFDVRQHDINLAVGNIVSALLEPLRIHSGTPRIGEKTPNNVFVFEQLHQMFPSCPLLHIIRDGRDVVASLLRQQWQTNDGKPMPITTDPCAAANYWVRAVQAGRRAAGQSQTLRDRYLEVRYEELVRAPEDSARAIFVHLGEQWEPEVLNFHEKETTIYGQVHRPISSASIGRWRNELSPEVQSAVKDIVGELLMELGYADGTDW